MADVYFKIGYFDPRDNQWHEGQPPVLTQQPQPQPQQQGQQVRVGYNQEGVQYMQPQPQSSYYAPGGTPTNVAVGVGNRGAGVRYNYNPQPVYRPAYGPYYGQQSYATRAPYAPGEPYYETVIGSNGQPVVRRFGEYSPNVQITGYETMFNSQGIPVQVPVYAPMNNSAVQVRVGTDVNGNPLVGNTQVNAVVPTNTATTSTSTTRVRENPQPVVNPQYAEEVNTQRNQRLTNEELNALTGTTTETTYSDPATSLPVPSEVDPTTLAIYTERIRKEEESKANSLQNVVGASPEDVRTLTDEEILREALRRIKRDDEALREAEKKNTSIQYVGI